MVFRVLGLRIQSTCFEGFMVEFEKGLGYMKDLNNS